MRRREEGVVECRVTVGEQSIRHSSGYPVKAFVDGY